MSKTIEKLTDEENERLRADVEGFVELGKEYHGRAEDAEARVRELTAENERLRAVVEESAQNSYAAIHAAEARLATAVGLLARAQDGSPKTPREANSCSVQLDYDISQLLQREGFVWDAINRVWRRLASTQPAQSQEDES